MAKDTREVVIADAPKAFSKTAPRYSWILTLQWRV